ncbi:MAG: DUF3105 domain-containing protein [Anaerolineales bacterium]|nr:DUF3105 domain-containing protein [Anaerolineales bacterium]
MAQPTKREIRRKQRNRQRILRIAPFVVIGALTLGILAIVVWNAAKPPAGEAFAILPADHVQDGFDPGSYNTDPPTSGPHYAESLQAGFYHDADVAAMPPYPVGYLVHNLEHGYVIFWYNCAALPEGADCDSLKSEIQRVMDRFDGVKLIAFPWETISEPVVLTSWGRMLRMSTFDPDAAINFVTRNRNRAPEPQAP